MRRALATLGLAAAAAIGVPAPAVAGGPTSVYITSPGDGRATGIYHTSPDYAELERLTSGTPVEDPPAMGAASKTYNLTWMIHDVSPWRIDYLVLDAPGGPFVGTTMLLDEADRGRDPRWYRVTEGKALAELLDRAFAGAAKAPAQSSIGLAPADATPDVRFVEVVEEAPWFSLDGWHWLVPGAAVGLLVGLAARGRRRVQGPRFELVDGEPEAVPAGARRDEGSGQTMPWRTTSFGS